MKKYRHWIIKYVFEKPFKVRFIAKRLYIALYTASELSRYDSLYVSYDYFVLVANLNMMLKELKTNLKLSIK